MKLFHQIFHNGLTQSGTAKLICFGRSNQSVLDEQTNEELINSRQNDTAFYWLIRKYISICTFFSFSRIWNWYSKDFYLYLYIACICLLPVFVAHIPWISTLQGATVTIHINSNAFLMEIYKCMKTIAELLNFTHINVSSISLYTHFGLKLETLRWMLKQNLQLFNVEHSAGKVSAMWDKRHDLFKNKEILKNID